MAKPTKPTTTTNASPAPAVAAPTNPAPAAPAAPTINPVIAQHMALAAQLAAVLGVPAPRVPTSFRWLVATAVWHAQGNMAQAAQHVAQWCAAYGCAVPPAGQYRVMQAWLSRGPARMAATGVARPGRQAAPAATAAPAVAGA